jgi:hypothetical protein
LCSVSGFMLWIAHCPSCQLPVAKVPRDSGDGGLLGPSGHSADLPLPGPVGQRHCMPCATASASSPPCGSDACRVSSLCLGLSGLPILSWEMHLFPLLMNLSNPLQALVSVCLFFREEAFCLLAPRLGPHDPTSPRLRDRAV